MKEAVVAEGPIVTIQDLPIPSIQDPRQLIIKVIFSGSNPKDWKGPTWYGRVFNLGDDIAGIVHEVGDDVTEFKVGDRVAAFHQMRTPGGSYAEYALAWDWTTFHIGKNTSFEEAATVPLSAMTATFSLYHCLAIPHPWTKAQKPTPLVIYGASGAVGAYAIKLASLSNIHPIICVAGRGAQFVDTLIDRTKGDTIVDYRQGDDATVEGLKQALNGQPLRYAFDAISENNTWMNIVKVLEPENGHLCLVLPDFSGTTYDDIPTTIKWSVARVGHAHEDIGAESGARLLARSFFRLFGNGLSEGWFKGHPHEVVPGGLAGIQTGLTNLKEGRASAVKYVFRISETPGLEGTS
ncbi:chaperonin 10-like protein [Ilyonectria robusta]|uniref:chaperonin 10-like protein n=1 Tax=Ilyonectria robusta TaxID=1079257 RepID=UPI001E8E53AB|nr:chaperonin 10-like protein [Ilyonectria robusta]KAH8663851.1 chaperonin 10-like protein [Ilyonectria robusta]